MSFIEGIGDDLLYAFCFILFIGIVSFAWLSSHVNYIHLPTTLFIIERRTHRRNEEQQLETNNSVPSTNETLIEHELDIESNENEQTPLSTESNTNIINSNETISQITTIEEEEEDQPLRITIKFLNDTQKSIIANSNDTISKIKRLYFADELTNNKIVRFIYQGRELKDNETLRTCNIHDQTTIHCQISTRRHSTINQVNNNNDISTTTTTQRNTNNFDTLSFIDTTPIHISPYFIFFITLILGSIWYLRIKYRLLFTPITTIILLLITIILLIFTCGILLTTRRQISNIRIPTHLHHVHLD